MQQIIHAQVMIICKRNSLRSRPIEGAAGKIEPLCKAGSRHACYGDYIGSWGAADKRGIRSKTQISIYSSREFYTKSAHDWRGKSDKSNKGWPRAIVGTGCVNMALSGKSVHVPKRNKDGIHKRRSNLHVNK